MDPVLTGSAPGKPTFHRTRSLTSAVTPIPLIPRRQHTNTSSLPDSCVTPGSLAWRSGSSHCGCRKRSPVAHVTAVFVSLQRFRSMFGWQCQKQLCVHEATIKVGFFTMTGFWIKEITEIYSFCTWRMSICILNKKRIYNMIIKYN